MNWRVGSKVAFWFLVSVLLYVVIKNCGVTDWWDGDTWQIIAAIATWLLAGGVVFAILQLRQARLNTKAQIAMDLYRELRNYETVEKIRSIYGLKPEDTKYLPTNKKKDIDYVLERFNMLGALVAQDIIDKQLAIETYSGHPALRC